jgi:hypothetical protein
MARHICIRPEPVSEPVSAKVAAQEVILARIMAQLLAIADLEAAVAVGKAQKWVVDMVHYGRTASFDFSGIETGPAVFGALEPFFDNNRFDTVKALVRIFMQMAVSGSGLVPAAYETVPFISATTPSPSK